MGGVQNKTKGDWALNSHWGAYGLGTGSVRAWVGSRRTEPVQKEYIRAVSPFLFISILFFSLYTYALSSLLSSLFFFSQEHDEGSGGTSSSPTAR